jgi:hypothetical protein
MCTASLQQPVRPREPVRAGLMKRCRGNTRARNVFLIRFETVHMHVWMGNSTKISSAHLGDTGKNASDIPSHLYFFIKPRFVLDTHRITRLTCWCQSLDFVPMVDALIKCWRPNTASVAHGFSRYNAGVRLYGYNSFSVFAADGLHIAMPLHADLAAGHGHTCAPNHFCKHTLSTFKPGLALQWPQVPAAVA